MSSDTAVIITAEGRAECAETVGRWLLCPVCGEPIRDGEDCYLLVREKLPWLPEDHADQDWDTIEWHVACDTSSPAPDGAADPPLRKVWRLDRVADRSSWPTGVASVRSVRGLD
jgi:hypothetical protein